MFWLAVIVGVALGMSAAIEYLLRRFGVRPTDVASAKGGAQVLAESIERWADQRRRRRP
jgi:hypothetical protein